MSFSDIQLVEIDAVSNRVRFGIKPTVVSGVYKLIQLVVLSLLDISGRDVLEPDKGAGLPDLVGRNFDPNDLTELYAEVGQKVKKAEKEVMEAQLGLTDSPEEKLRQLKVLGIKQGDSIDEILIRIRVINEAGRAADIVV